MNASFPERERLKFLINQLEINSRCVIYLRVTVAVLTRADCMPVEKKKGISRLTYSIRNSWAGFIDAVLTEDAFRQLLVINAILLVVTFGLDITNIERLLLITCSFLLLVVELLNTAIETVVDRISLELHPLSKRAKDLGGAAQLVAVVMTIIIWGMVLLGR
ncbi:diacylglycerol kinase [Serratia marcescens]|uniref:diacylglycerol kinase n=1 Tax=Serratia marcescens TaxID=615 RepID=UPI001F52B2AD|nr:diacylglycerol kinase [Serratia marcescens]